MSRGDSRGAGGVILLLVFLLSPLALAQEAPPVDLEMEAPAPAPEPALREEVDPEPRPGRRSVAEARRHFEQGVALFQEDDVEAALAEFRASYRLNPLPQVLFNIAVSLRRLHRYAEAADTLRRYLREGIDESPERRALAQDLIAELEAVLADVELDVDRPEADVFVDGELIGRTPLDEPLRLAAGEHHVEVRLDGFRTFRERIEVHGGQELTLTVELEEVRSPWYRRWWVWTIVGAVVVASTTVGLAVGLSGRPQETELEVVVERGEP